MTANGSTSGAAAEETLHQPNRRGRKSKYQDPAQKRATKNARDRARRAKDKEELQRLRRLEAQFKIVEPECKKVKDVNIQLERENEELKSQARNLESTIKEKESTEGKGEGQKMSDEEFQQWLEDLPALPSSILIEDIAGTSNDGNRKPLEQVANCQPLTEPQGNTPSQTGTALYTDELVGKFINELYTMKGNKVKFQDFDGLQEELEILGTSNILPPSLGPIDERIRGVHGDITSEIALPHCVRRHCYILFCSVIKEMDELKLEQVDEKKILFWRDAIHSGLFIGMKGQFAMDHLKKIAHAFYGLKAWNDGCNDKEDIESIEQRMSELQKELRSLEEKHAKKTEEQSSEVRKQCISVAEEFRDKPLSTYLFPPASH